MLKVSSHSFTDGKLQIVQRFGTMFFLKQMTDKLQSTICMAAVSINVLHLLDFYCEVLFDSGCAGDAMTVL